MRMLMIALTLVMKGIGKWKTIVQGQFHTKEMGQLQYFLGIEVAQSKEGINMS